MTELAQQLFRRFVERPGVLSSDMRRGVEQRARPTHLPLLDVVRRRWTIVDRSGGPGVEAAAPTMYADAPETAGSWVNGTSSPSRATTGQVLPRPQTRVPTSPADAHPPRGGPGIASGS